MATKKELAEQAKQEAKAQLLKALKPGDTVYCILRNVSRSGMARRIDVYAKDHVYLSGWAATAIGARRHTDGSIKMGGCGMDMGFALVYELSHALFKDGFTCTGDRCPSNDHSNGDRNRKPHLHKDGGYALKHQWL